MQPMDIELTAFWARRRDPNRRRADLWAEDWAQIERAQTARQEQFERAREQALDRAAQASCVAILLILLVLLLIFLSLNGFGPPDRGGGFRYGSANLRDGASGKLAGARPTVWSGAHRGAADSYEDKIHQQRGYVEAIAAADQQVANTLEVQADQVELGRLGLIMTIFSLLAEIEIAEAMEAELRVLTAIGSPAAPAVAANLEMFTMTVACTTAMAALELLVFLIGAGVQNYASFNKAKDHYKWVAHASAAKVPFGQAPAGVVPTVLTPTAADFFDTPTGLSEAAGQSADLRNVAGVIAALPRTVGTLGELAELARHVTRLCAPIGKPATREKGSAKQPVAPVPQWLAAMAAVAQQPAVPVANEESVAGAQGRTKNG